MRRTIPLIAAGGFLTLFAGLLTGRPGDTPHRDAVLAAAKEHCDATEAQAKRFGQQLADLRKAAAADKDTGTVELIDALGQIADGGIARLDPPNPKAGKGGERFIRVRGVRRGTRVRRAAGRGSSRRPAEDQSLFGRPRPEPAGIHGAGRCQALQGGRNTFAPEGEPPDAVPGLHWEGSTNPPQQASEGRPRGGGGGQRGPTPPQTREIVLEVTADNKDGAHAVWVEPRFVW